MPFYTYNNNSIENKTKPYKYELHGIVNAESSTIVTH